MSGASSSVSTVCAASSMRGLSGCRKSSAMSSAPRMRSASAVDRTAAPRRAGAVRMVDPAVERREVGPLEVMRLDDGRRREQLAADVAALREARERALEQRLAARGLLVHHGVRLAERQARLGLAHLRRHRGQPVGERLAPAFGQQLAPGVQREADQRLPCLRFDVERGGGVEIAARRRAGRPRGRAPPAVPRGVRRRRPSSSRNSRNSAWNR